MISLNLNCNPCTKIGSKVKNFPWASPPGPPAGRCPATPLGAGAPRLAPSMALHAAKCEPAERSEAGVNSNNFLAPSRIFFLEPCSDDVDWFHALYIDYVICYQNWRRSNYNELTMLPKAAISVLESFQFVNTQSQRKLETPKFKHSALGLKFLKIFRPPCPIAGHVPGNYRKQHFQGVNVTVTAL